MRRVINKLITEEDLYSAVDAAFSNGWRRVKLYFLIGLPTEQDEDVLGIVALARRCVEIGRTHHRSPTVVASVGGFVPKPQTLLQWFGQDTAAELRRRKVYLVEGRLPEHPGSALLRWHDPSRPSVVEGLVSRGDRRMGAVIERVWRAGGTFQEWSERFKLRAYLGGRPRCRGALPSESVVHRQRDERRAAPVGPPLGPGCTGTSWGTGRTLAAVAVEDCRWTPRYDCGACTDAGLETRWPGGPAVGREPGDRPISRPGAGPFRRRRGVEERLRIRFAKLGKVRFTSRDVARCGVGAAADRRRGWPSPRGSTPGCSSPSVWPSPPAQSLAEYLDIALAHRPHRR